MMKVTNNSPAPQGIRTLRGLVYIPPGATRDVSLSAEQATRARRLTFLTVEGEADFDVGASDAVEARAAELERATNVLHNPTDALVAASEEIYRLRGELRAVRAGLGERDATIADLTAKLADATAEIESLRAAANAPPAEPAVYEAKHRGGGSYSILDAVGAEVVDKLTKAEAEDFNAMSAEDKAAYVAAVAASRK